MHSVSLHPVNLSTLVVRKSLNIFILVTLLLRQNTITKSNLRRKVCFIDPEGQLIMAREARRGGQGAKRAHLNCAHKGTKRTRRGVKAETLRTHPQWHTFSGKAPPSEDCITSPDSAIKWRQSVQICEPLGDIPHSSHLPSDAWT